MRTVVAGLVALGLAIAVFLAWPRAPEEEEPEIVSEPTTTTMTGIETTTSLVVTTTTESHVVRTVEEAEEILRDLWFGWFEGIYDQDEDRIREVVANPDLVEAALAQFGVMTFTQAPSERLLTFSDTEILLSDERCLAIWTNVDASQLIGGSNDGVHVFVWRDDSWNLISQWAHREDLWEDDCSSQPLP